MSVRPYAERGFAAGDLVMARRNDYSRWMINGDHGVVTEVDVDHGELTVRLGQRHAHVRRNTCGTAGSTTATR